jgi:hypothetical protein
MLKRGNVDSQRTCWVSPNRRWFRAIGRPSTKLGHAIAYCQMGYAVEHSWRLLMSLVATVAMVQTHSDAAGNDHNAGLLAGGRGS